MYVPVINFIVGDNLNNTFITAVTKFDIEHSSFFTYETTKKLQIKTEKNYCKIVIY